MKHSGHGGRRIPGPGKRLGAPKETLILRDGYTLRIGIRSAEGITVFRGKLNIVEDHNSGGLYAVIEDSGRLVSVSLMEDSNPMEDLTNAGKV